MRSIFLIATFIILGYQSRSQQTDVVTSVANKIADRIKDSLSLTTEQRNGIYQANLWIHQQKQGVRTQYSSTDSVRIHIQRIENKRDSVYYLVLPMEKYEAYLIRKIELIRND